MVSSRANMLRRLAPFLITTGVALVHVALMARAALHHTGDHWCYPLDDTFIHLSLARHLAFDGVFGVTNYGFTSAASSVIWPLLLAAAMKIVGNHVILPFVLNVIAGVALCWVITDALGREAASVGTWARAAIGAAIVLIVPLATMMMLGMEHVLHMALALAFVLEAGRVISSSRERAGRLVLLACLLVATRYEGLFSVGIAAGLILLRRRFALGAGLVAAGAAPIVLFGAYSLAHGGLFLPNSVLLKGRHLAISDISDVGDLLGGDVLNVISIQSYLLPLVFGTLALLVRAARRQGIWAAETVRLVVAFGTTIAHVELARLGWFYRYEAYLVVVDSTVIAIALARAFPEFSFKRAWRDSPIVAIGTALTILVGCAPLAVRALAAQGSTPLAVQNIFQQQVQTARFLKRYFPRDPVAINDIGAVSYYGDEPIVDLVGLASLPIARAKSMQLEKLLSSAQLERFAKVAPVAVIYDDWFAPNVPPSWVRLGRLRIDSNRACAFDSVSVYATSGAQVPRVLAALDGFSRDLPAGVRQEGRFVETPPPTVGDYTLDSGDVLYVEMKGAPDLSAVESVGDDGSFFVGKVGEIKARGLTLAAAVDAIRAKAEHPAMPLPGPIEPAVRLLERRRCRVQVVGDVLRRLDLDVDCGTPASKMISEAGRDASDPVRAYLWRTDGGGLRRIEFDYNPRSDAAGRDIGLQSGDIVVVP